MMSAGRKCRRIYPPAFEVDVIADMEADDAAPNDVVVEISDREDTIYLAFHRHWGEGHAGRPNHDAWRLFQPCNLKFVHVRGMLHRGTMHCVDQRQGDEIRDEFA